MSGFSGTPQGPERKVLRDVAHDGIRDAILNGVVGPGDLLETGRVRAMLGVPAQPVREAMNALVMEGLLEEDGAGRIRVVSPDPETVGDALRTIGVLMGGVVRLTVPVVSVAGRTILLGFVEDAEQVARREHARSHALIAIEFYGALLRQCPNPVLSALTRSSLVPLSYHYLVSIDHRALDWEKLRASWEELRRGISAGDPVRSELAVEALHGLPRLESPSP